MKSLYILFFLLIFFNNLSYGKTNKLSDLLAPGEFNQFHLYISGIRECTKCHELITGISETKCLNCHKIIKKRINNKQGYHGKLSKQCLSCHSEHEKNIIKNFKHREFNHNISDFALSGKHIKTKCEKCHLRKEKHTGLKRFTYIGISTICADCHKNIHKEKKLNKCQDCHVESYWKKSVFDHNSQSKYKLTGLHSEVKCTKCHKKAKNKKLRDYRIADYDKCLTCHKDTHKGELSSDCLKCHTLKGWKKLNFSHNNTKYKLKFKHKNISCNDCHKNKKYKVLKYQDCIDCHKKTAHYKPQLPCTNCHTEKGWNELLPQWKKTALKGHNKYRYPLKGKHIDVKCDKCHTFFGKFKYFNLKYKACIDCHKKDEHKGQFKDKACKDCHVVDDFKEKLLFKHEKAKFKLEMLHKKVKCNKCHIDKKYTPLPIKCKNCHKNVAKFYNGTSDYTKFSPLASPKAKLVRCKECHETKKEKFKVDSKKCVSCHGKLYKDFYDVWNTHIKRETNDLIQALSSLKLCSDIPKSEILFINSKVKEIEFIKKYFHHNYELSQKIINQVKLYYDVSHKKWCN